MSVNAVSPVIKTSSDIRNKNFYTKKQSCAETTSEKKELSNKSKSGILLSAFIGMSIALAHTFKKKGYSLNLKKIFNSNPKEWAIFNIKYDKNKQEIEKLVTKLAAGSILGGLLGGAVFDKKENMNSKYRESIIQMLGNVLTPLAFVSVGMRGFEKIEPNILKMLPKTNTKQINTFIKSAPNVLASISLLFAGILSGNKVGNFLNEKLFNIKDNRKIKLSDLSPHVDDVCLVTSLVAAKSNIGTQISKIIPIALLVPGYCTGVQQEQSCTKK